jgi:hypothetical protein
MNDVTDRCRCRLVSTGKAVSDVIRSDRLAAHVLPKCWTLVV